MQIEWQVKREEKKGIEDEDRLIGEDEEKKEREKEKKKDSDNLCFSNWTHINRERKREGNTRWGIERDDEDKGMAMMKKDAKKKKMI